MTTLCTPENVKHHKMMLFVYRCTRMYIFYVYKKQHKTFPAYKFPKNNKYMIPTTLYTMCMYYMCVTERTYSRRIYDGIVINTVKKE